MKRIKVNAALYVAAVALIAGCSGGGTSGPTGPMVRAINGLQGVQLATVTVGTVQVAANLPYATLSGSPHTPYVTVVPGGSTITFASSATPATLIASGNRTFVDGDVVDAVAYGTTTPTVLQLNDDISLPTASALRFVNASPAAGPVDAIVTGGVFSGLNTAVGGVSPVQTSGVATYQTIATTGVYQLSVFPAGQDNGAPLISESFTLNAGTRWTLVLLDSATGGGTPLLLQVQDNLLTDTSTAKPKRGT